MSVFRFCHTRSSSDPSISIPLAWNRCPKLSRFNLLASLAVSSLSARYFLTSQDQSCYFALHDARSRCKERVHFPCMARADVRVRIRPGVIRVRIAETGIRTVIRIRTPIHQLISFLPTTCTCRLSCSDELGRWIFFDTKLQLQWSGC